MSCRRRRQSQGGNRRRADRDLWRAAVGAVDDGRRTGLTTAQAVAEAAQDGKFAGLKLTVSNYRWWQVQFAHDAAPAAPDGGKCPGVAVAAMHDVAAKAMQDLSGQLEAARKERDEYKAKLVTLEGLYDKTKAEMGAEIARLRIPEWDVLKAELEAARRELVARDGSLAGSRQQRQELAAALATAQAEVARLKAPLTERPSPLDACAERLRLVQVCEKLLAELQLEAAELDEALCVARRYPWAMHRLQRAAEALKVVDGDAENGGAK